MFPINLIDTKGSTNPAFGVLGIPPTQRLNQGSIAQPVLFHCIANQEACERREKKLCYYYGEKFVTGQHYARLQLFMIEDPPPIHTNESEDAFPK